MYEKPAGSSSSSAYTPVAKAKVDEGKVELEGWKAGVRKQVNHHLHHHNHRAQAKVDILTQDDLSTSADSSGNWLTKSVSVGKSITAGKPSTAAKQRGEPKAEARDGFISRVCLISNRFFRF